MSVKVTVTEKELDNQNGHGGLEICIPGLEGNPQDPEGGVIFVEKYDGNIRLVVWNGEQDPQITQLIPAKPRCKGCGQDLSKHKSVQRTYVNKTREDEDGIVFGYYDEGKGEFCPNEKIEWDNDCSYDFTDIPDNCTNCGQEI